VGGRRHDLNGLGWGKCEAVVNTVMGLFFNSIG